jgi:hypothetical protein
VLGRGIEREQRELDRLRSLDPGQAVGGLHLKDPPAVTGGDDEVRVRGPDGPVEEQRVQAGYQDRAAGLLISSG